MVIDLSKYQNPTNGDYDLAAALNSEPDNSFIKAHPYLPGKKSSGEKHKYVRVSVCRQILDLLFPMRWSWENTKTGENMHGTDYIVEGTLTIVTKDGFVRKIGGVGADAYQVNKDTGAVQQNAVMLSVPKAEAAAFKNAAKKLGRIFGSELDKEANDQVDFLGAALEKEKPLPLVDTKHDFWAELCFIAANGKNSKGREIAGGVKAFLDKYQFSSEDLAYLLSLESARKEALPVSETPAPAPADTRTKVSSINPADKKVWGSILKSIETGKTSKGNAATVDGICEHYVFSEEDYNFLVSVEEYRRADEVAKQAQKQAVEEANEDGVPF